MLVSFNPLPRILGAGLLLLAAIQAPAQNLVTFSVDMNSQPAALTTNVYVRGTFNNWGTAFVLTNDGAGIFSGTFDVTDTPGTVEACKFFYYPAPSGETWESDPNRQFVLVGGAQTLPLTTWEVKNWPLPSFGVQFKVDMSAQVLLGKFTNNAPGSFVRLSGAFLNNWNTPSADFTNDLSATGLETNIYSQTIPIQGFPGTFTGEYKFRAPIGDTWETVNNRPSFQLTGGEQSIPLVFWDNASTCDLVQQDTTVTFVLHITNGTPDVNGVPFNKATDYDKLHINGGFLGWWAWWDGVTAATNAANQLTNNPEGSDYYQQTFIITRGSPLATKFKFTFSGADTEAGFQTDHVNYVRTLGSSYTFPVAEFGTNFAALREEQSFGDLRLAPASGGIIPINWLGRQCVTLQTKPAIPGGSWTDLPATDGTSSTNWPNGGGNQFFRLQKRQGI